MTRILAGFIVVLAFAQPAQAQFVSKVSVAQEMKRLGTACIKFVEVGPGEMPDFRKSGYKLNKQGFGGKDFFANKSLHSKKTDLSKLTKGAGTNAMIDWHNGRRHQCDFSIGLRLENDQRLALKIESDFHKLLRANGYKKTVSTDKKGRKVVHFVKGVNKIHVSAKVGFGRRDPNLGSVSFGLWNRNDAARKN